MLTKEPEMLQSDAFYEHTMQQNAAGAPMGAYSASADTLAGFKGPRGGGTGEGRGGEGKERRLAGREGKGG